MSVFCPFYGPAPASTLAKSITVCFGSSICLHVCTCCTHEHTAHCEHYLSNSWREYLQIEVQREQSTAQCQKNKQLTHNQLSLSLHISTIVKKNKKTTQKRLLGRLNFTAKSSLCICAQGDGSS